MGGVEDVVAFFKKCADQAHHQKGQTKVLGDEEHHTCFSVFVQKY